MAMTEKQLRVVEMTNEGRSPKYIARKLGTTERAIKTYITKLTKRGHLGDAEQAVEPAVVPAVESALTPGTYKINGAVPELMQLGAAVQFLQIAGSVQNARNLIEQVRSLR